MAIYRAGSEPSPSLLKLKRRAPWWFAGSLLLLILSLFLSLCYQPVASRIWAVCVVNSIASLSFFAAIFSGLAMLGLRRGLRNSQRQEFEVTPAGISRRDPNLPDLFVPIEDVVSFHMRSGSLLIRLRKNPRLLLVPATIAGIDQFRQELTAMGVPQTATTSLRMTTILKLLAIFFLMGVCGAMLFWGKNPILIGAAGLCYVAFQVWFMRQGKSNPYVLRKPRQWGWLVVAALWLFVVVMRVERAAHRRPVPLTQCVDQPSSTKAKH